MRPPDVIGERFELVALAGSGGMGAVYRARDRAGGGEVAVKVLLAKSGDAIARFVREAEALAALEHPAIVRYVAHGATGAGDLYLAMEWLDGEDLAARIARGPLTIAESLEITARAAEALGAAHAQGIVHRDVKPSNLFLAGGAIARLKVLDFGIARFGAAAPDRASTEAGAMIGTPGYMAPEQARGDAEVDARADLFALGCVLFECLTGRAAFVGAHPMAVLAKILLEPPPKLREVRADLPGSLDGLVARMLAPSREERPRDVAALLAELSAVESTGSSARTPPRPSLAPSALPEREQRPLCVILAGAPVRSEDLLAAPTLAVTDLAAPELSAIVEACGGKLSPLADGSIVATLWGSRNATDQVARAARCALAMRAHLPGARVALATGRGVFAGRWPVGEVIDRAARLLHRGGGAPGSIRIDEVTAGLLDTRFEVLGEGGFLTLRAEREAEGSARTLLGRPTPCVGREREITSLLSLYEQTVSEPVARAALVIGDAGIGKSRLRHEVLQAIRARGEPVEIWTSRGDAMAVGSPFGMIAPALRRAAGILDGEALDVRRRKLSARVARHMRGADAERTAAFLGELTGTPFTDASRVELHAARQDPMLMGDQMRRAFEDLLAAECAAQPVLFVLEDLHWGDLPSLKVLESALRSAPDLPFMVLGIARPEVHDRFPDLFRDRQVEEIRLAKLTKRGSEKLVRTVLGEGAPAKVVEQITSRAAGNALYLEELIRAVAEGHGDRLPETVLTMAQARMDQLGAETRRVLRAASVFGEVFWAGGLLALLADEGGAAEGLDLDARLREMIDRELLVRRGAGKFPGQEDLAFRHGLLREAAYETFVPEDRVLAHRLAGRWLAEAGESEAVVLAEHFERGDAKGEAIAWYARAAEQALEGDDLGAAIARAERGLACGAAEEVRGALLLLMAEAELWRGDNGACVRLGFEAMAWLPRGGPEFCRAAGQVAAASGRLGDGGRMDAIEKQLLALAREGAKDGAFAIACARTAMSRLVLGQLDRAPALLDVVHRIAPSLGAGEPLALAWIARAGALDAYVRGDLGGYLAQSEAVTAGFEEAGDRRVAALQRVNVGYAHLVLGSFADAERALRASVAQAGALGLGIVKANAQHNLGMALGRLGAIDEGIAVEAEAESAFREQGDRRLEAGSRMYLAVLRALGGDLTAAEADARTAIAAASDLAGVQGHALAVLADVLLAAGRPAEAGKAASEAMSFVESGALEAGEALARLTFAESLWALGDAAGAAQQIRTARERLLEKAEKIRDPALRESFLRRVPEHARTLRRAGEWGE